MRTKLRDNVIPAAITQVIFCCLCVTQFTYAGEQNAVHLSDIYGRVFYRSDASQAWQTLNQNSPTDYHLPIELKTGQSGRLLVHQGDTTLTVRPASHLRLSPGDAGNTGLLEIIKQLLVRLL